MTFSSTPSLALRSRYGILLYCLDRFSLMVFQWSKKIANRPGLDRWSNRFVGFQWSGNLNLVLIAKNFHQNYCPILLATS